MRSKLIVALSLTAVASATFAVAQERVRPKGPADFDTVHAKAKPLPEEGVVIDFGARAYETELGHFGQ